MLLEAILLASAMNGVTEAVGAEVAAEPNAPIRTSYVAGRCQAGYEYTGDSEWAQNRMIGIEHAAMDYVREQLGRNADLPLPSAITVERYPKNGTLNVGYASGMDAEQGERQYWRYTPNPNYIGTDRAQFVVNVQGIPVRVVVVLKVVPMTMGDDELFKACKIWHWIISAISCDPMSDSS